MFLKGIIDINEPEKVTNGGEHALSNVIPWLFQSSIRLARMGYRFTWGTSPLRVIQCRCPRELELQHSMTQLALPLRLELGILLEHAL
jgi:hypothetical protein